MPNAYQIESLDNLLSLFFSSITQDDGAIDSSPFLCAMKDIYFQRENSDICYFDLDDNSTAAVIERLKNSLKDSHPNCYPALNMPLTYLLDELICNIQQHAQTDKGKTFR